MREKQYVDGIASDLETAGFITKREYRYPRGHIDVFAFQGTPQNTFNAHIIEAKMNTDLQSVTQAIGQLMYYGAAWGGRVGMWFASPKDTERYTEHVFDQLGIGVYRGDPSSLNPWSSSEIEAAHTLVQQSRRNTFWNMINVTSGRIGEQPSFVIPSRITLEMVREFMESGQ